MQQDGGNMLMRQSGSIESGERVHIYSADMRRTVSLQFYPDGYDLVEPQPVLVSEGYSSHQAGVQGRQKLPDKFHVARAGSEPQEIFLDRDIDMEAWQMNDKVSKRLTLLMEHKYGSHCQKVMCLCLAGQSNCRLHALLAQTDNMPPYTRDSETILQSMSYEVCVA